MANLSERDRITKLNELEIKFKQYIADQRERLELERRFLALVRDSQGLSNATRRNANLDTLASLATVKELLPTLELENNA